MPATSSAKARIGSLLYYDFPLFYQALKAGEVHQAEEFLSSSGIETGRTEHNVQTLAMVKKSFPLYWRALLRGEVRGARAMVQQITSRPNLQEPVSPQVHPRRQFMLFSTPKKNGRRMMTDKAVHLPSLPSFKSFDSMAGTPKTFRTPTKKHTTADLRFSPPDLKRRSS